ncbi:lysophospholipid acyltransferase family protein [Acetobacter fallax]|uniref:Lauroyl acyltransferase n=1 Tax=Acetobacter fallax TaxID=1737473 RepID=A0ABX0K9V7_9PROT|nr:lauroyl acyltransferase [Acetobacter fallax]NHO33204.1 lauroyl acyltransferase [Acetobacter fallax]NHO36778.1 lauroyl acyltransferase [Acetobacter fallax]
MTFILSVLHRFFLAAQTYALWQAVVLLRLPAPRHASDAGGYLMRRIGMRLSASRVADRNLRCIMPELDGLQRRRIIGDVWDNLGRNVAELLHLHRFGRTESGPGWEVEGGEHLEALRKRGGQALFFSGHCGNWEMILPIAGSLGFEVSGFYRASSNPVIDRMIQGLRQRALGAGSKMFPKGGRGARQALVHVRDGGSLGFLIDQKMNDGLSVPFMGREAMMAPAVAQMALRFGLPVVPVYVVRLGAARFRLVCEAPLDVALTGERHADVKAICVGINDTLGRWVRERPGAWLWLHRRWPKSMQPEDVVPLAAVEAGTVCVGP